MAFCSRSFSLFLREAVSQLLQLHSFPIVHQLLRLMVQAYSEQGNLVKLSHHVP
jgi:hypothetical protein